MLSLLTVQQSSDGKEITSAKTSYCFGCEKFLCGTCVNAHELFREAAFNGHKVTPVKQLEQEDYEAFLKRKVFCTEKYHEKEVTRFYCHVCHTCICQTCFSMEHRNHEIELLDKVADDERGKILKGVELMNQKQECCRERIRQCEETVANLEANNATAKHQVSQSAGQMIAVIHELERAAINTLENTRVTRIQKLHAMKTQLRHLEKTDQTSGTVCDRTGTEKLERRHNRKQKEFTGTI